MSHSNYAANCIRGFIYCRSVTNVNKLLFGSLGEIGTPFVALLLS